MKPYHLIIPLSAFLLVSASSCSLKKPKAEEERENWIYSLNDSIAKYKNEIETATSELSSSQAEVGELISNFDYISNPREVEGYYIYNGWKNRYPLKQTGIVARITEDERFELIAVLSGGGHFNQIAVSGGDGEASTKVVPHDQALNYRAGNLNTVCFYGGAADSVGMYIAENMPDKLTVTYLDGKKTGSFTIPAEQKEMVAATYQLYAAKRANTRLEGKIPMLSRKIDSCRRMIESLDSVKKQ